MITAEQLTQWMSNYRSFIVYDKAFAEEFISKMKSVKEVDKMGDLFTDWLMSQNLVEEIVL
jgi:hypothetical protein